MKWLLIVAMSIGVCIAYGLIHDQITVRICLEYFTVGHPPVFSTQDPTLLAIGWGVLATWWVGVLLGVPLATAARCGSWPKREPGSLIRPLIRLAVGVAVVAAISGVMGGVAARTGLVHLTAPFDELVPRDRHIPFLVDLWTHNASYLAGFMGGCALIGLVLLDRRRRCETSRDRMPATLESPLA